MSLDNKNSKNSSDDSANSSFDSSFDAATVVRAKVSEDTDIFGARTVVRSAPIPSLAVPTPAPSAVTAPQAPATPIVKRTTAKLPDEAPPEVAARQSERAKITKAKPVEESVVVVAAAPPPTSSDASSATPSATPVERRAKRVAAGRRHKFLFGGFTACLIAGAALLFSTQNKRSVDIATEPVPSESASMASESSEPPVSVRDTSDATGSTTTADFISRFDRAALKSQEKALGYSRSGAGF